MDWNKVQTEKDLPELGKLVIVCRDLGDRLQYYITTWKKEDVKYWIMNDIVGWMEFKRFE